MNDHDLIEEFSLFTIEKQFLNNHLSQITEEVMKKNILKININEYKNEVINEWTQIQEFQEKCKYLFMKKIPN